MSEKVALARQALRAALQLRRSLSIARESPVNAFDVAQMIGIDVRFLDAPSLEGMFVRDPGPRILLPSSAHRPKARIAFSCAHEIGHQQFDHGTRADHYLDLGPEHDAFVPDEYLADAFAGHLLMPRAAVMGAFDRRNWNAEAPTPLQVFVVACELGVGYETLILHLHIVLEVLTAKMRGTLLGSTPKSIKSELIGKIWAGPLTVIDDAWKHAFIDLEVGEILALPTAPDSKCELLELNSNNGGRVSFTALKSGVAEFTAGMSRKTLRVSRQHYVGPYSNRYLTDPDEH